MVAHAQVGLLQGHLAAGAVEAERIGHAAVAAEHMDLLGDRERSADETTAGFRVAGRAVMYLQASPAAFHIGIAQAVGGRCRERRHGQQAGQDQGVAHLHGVLSMVMSVSAGPSWTGSGDLVSFT